MLLMLISPIDIFYALAVFTWFTTKNELGIFFFHLENIKTKSFPEDTHNVDLYTIVITKLINTIVIVSGGELGCM